MKTFARSTPRAAFSRKDALVTTATVVFLFVLLTVVSTDRSKQKRTSCVMHLKQIGLAFKTWSLDCQDRYVMGVPEKQGGTMEAIGRGEVFRHFQAMSNELRDAKVLICPSDTRLAAKSLAVMSNTNLSYFVGVDAQDICPQMFLAGDRNITNGPLAANRLLTLDTNSSPGWTPEIHRGHGNVLLADGSVLQWDSAGLALGIKNTGSETTRLAIP